MINIQNEEETESQNKTLTIGFNIINNNDDKVRASYMILTLPETMLRDEQNLTDHKFRFIVKAFINQLLGLKASSEYIRMESLNIRKW